MTPCMTECGHSKYDPCHNCEPLDAPPSAPVGVEAPADEFNGDTPRLIRCIESLLRLDEAGALVPHGVGGHARTMLAAAAKRLAQQPAAVDDAMVERATMALLGKTHDSAPGVDWRCDRSWTVNRVRELMRLALSAALAGQQGGEA